LNRILAECSFRRLRDIVRDKVERWLDTAEADGLSPATRNEYLISLSAFCNWAVKSERLARNPVTGIGKADRSADRRHLRRALTVEEVSALLDAARHRPVAEIGRASVALPKEERRGRSSWTFEPLTAENFQRCYVAGLERLADQAARLKKLQRLGRERAMFYLLAVSTGLRRKELASLTVGQIHLAAVPTPYLALAANDAKNGQSANLPLRPDVVAELREYLSGRGDRLDAKLFVNPPTIRVFDADIQAAGIAKTDHRDRVVDIHALRHTFGTHLSAAGVHPRTAMAAMRHSRIELTMNLYTDPVLLDIAGAVNSLPNFAARPAQQAVIATAAAAI
jgi:integrase